MLQRKNEILPLVITFHFYFLVFSRCSENEPHKTTSWWGFSLQSNQNSAPGFGGILKLGGLCYLQRCKPLELPEWTELEPAINVYSFQDIIINPLTLLDPDEIKFKAIFWF